MNERTCAKCGADCKGRKVWERYGRSKVICMACGPAWTFSADGKTVVRRRKWSEVKEQEAA